MKACITDDMKRAMEAGVGGEKKQQGKSVQINWAPDGFFEKIQNYTFTAYMRQHRVYCIHNCRTVM